MLSGETSECLETSALPLVKESGPLIVSIDTEGRNLFEENKVVFNERKEKRSKKSANMCLQISCVRALKFTEKSEPLMPEKRLRFMKSEIKPILLPCKNIP